MHEREEVAAHPAQVWGGDGDRRVRRQRGVDCIAAEYERPYSGLRRELVGAGNQPVRRADGMKAG